MNVQWQHFTFMDTFSKVWCHSRESWLFAILRIHINELHTTSKVIGNAQTVAFVKSANCAEPVRVRKYVKPQLMR